MANIPEHRKWMYNRLLPGRKGYTDEFLMGVEEFVNYASTLPVYMDSMQIRCPCSKCKNRVHLSADDVRVHLYKKGFEPNYWIWTCHGELTPSIQPYMNEGATENNLYEQMVFDVAGPSFFPLNAENEQDEEPHSSARNFYDLLNAARQPLSMNVGEETELAYTLMMMNIKTTYNIPQVAMDQIFQYNNRMMGPDNRVPTRYYDAKKLLTKLGLGHEKIDCCVNNCMLYYKSEINDRQCKFCGEPRFKPCPPRSTRVKEVPRKRMHYLPLIPRLQRLYASHSSASQMRWHYENRREHGIMCHPSDGEAWKHFDRKFPDFAADPRNVRLGLCSDGFSPFGFNVKPYSCWPVMVVPYNLPPSMCMTTPYTFLTCIIPGPKNPKANIDVYLQPLIDELQLLWEIGVLTYDASLKQNFMMRAALMWTINDFPAYGMLSGWQTAGKLACPYCLHYSKSFYLKNGHKTCWFDCHRQFLPMNHSWRKNRDTFVKRRVEKSRPPPIWTGDELFHSLENIPRIIDGPIHRIEGFGQSHNWKKKSIFWDLPYWKDNLLRHNLDVMHIEKNVFDNIFHTVMDVKGTGKNKDTPSARLDMKDVCNRLELELVEKNGRYLMPKASYSLNRTDQLAVFEWLRTLKLPDGFSSNLATCVDSTSSKLIGMKSHDCHIFMQFLLPVAFMFLPSCHWKPLTELSAFFRNLCSTSLRVDKIHQMENSIVLTLCKLERFFPPALYDCMEHLPVHLPYEARLGGPVQYRWMYPFERFLNHLKSKMKNKRYVEGSIADAYMLEESTHFASFYFDDDVQSRRTRIGRNLNDGGIDPNLPVTLSIFNRPGRSMGMRKTRYLSVEERFAAHQYVLLNCEEVQPILRMYENGLRRYNPGCTDEDVDDEIERNFAHWFKEYVYSLMNNVCNQSLIDLASGPIIEVRTYTGYVVNGFKFQTGEHCRRKSTSNYGVSIKGTGLAQFESNFFGTLQEVVEVEYPNVPLKKVVLFKCE
ncbi:uncharacterized protein LOC116015735 [Ipomoea triloba]|uniref:uncharacterized protein LOC116015735 n=1 Tax=Ipomoea triloba TaxID=35885 RepID=UPI00125D04E2|nr:uncharacterized protein LOC116015735 [Ipomoea triloba]